MEFLYENGEPVNDKTTVPPPSMPSDCELCLKDHGETKWELNTSSQKWFHWCCMPFATRTAIATSGTCGSQNDLGVTLTLLSHGLAIIALSETMSQVGNMSRRKTCTFTVATASKGFGRMASRLTPAGYISYIPTSQAFLSSVSARFSKVATLTLPYSSRRPDFIWRNNRSQRDDNCAWVTLSGLLISQNVQIIMDTASIYRELANVGITPAKMDGPAAPEDILPVAEQFGAIEKIMFTDGGSQGVPASELPTRGVPPRKEFATSVRIKDLEGGHVVVGYWAPCTPKSSGNSSTHWFRFMDYQANDPGKDVTNWVMEQDKLIRYVYWFVQDLQ